MPLFQTKRDLRQIIANLTRDNDYLRRKIDSLSRGEPFDEPDPDGLWKGGLIDEMRKRLAASAPRQEDAPESEPGSFPLRFEDGGEPEQVHVLTGTVPSVPELKVLARLVLTARGIEGLSVSIHTVQDIAEVRLR